MSSTRAREEQLRGQVEHLQQLLEEAHREFENFAYAVSHDVRAPLRAIEGFADILLEDFVDQLDEEGARYLKIIGGSANKMQRLMSDLLTFSRLNRPPVQPIPLDLTRMFRSALQRAQAKHPDRRFELVVAEVPPAVGDFDLIGKLVDILVSNAVKFTGPKPVARIEFGSETEEGERVSYFLRDNGAGFDMQHAGKLFTVFQRMHREDEFPGSGVGLAMAQRILHRHGGRIWCNAKRDEGAKFSFTLPPTAERGAAVPAAD